MIRVPRPRIGLLGGSFNPAHGGHRAISLMALERLRLDQVWWLVSPQNPLKPVAGMAPLGERLAGAARFARHGRIRALDIEARLGTVYTVDTVAALRRRFAGVDFVWLMGADNLSQLPAWRDWQRLFRLLPIAIFNRPTYADKALSGLAARRYRRYRIPEREAPRLPGRRPPAWVFIPGIRNRASATALRNAGRGTGPG
jgi:nicotinate-nucleotide adenylyltransferase